MKGLSVKQLYDYFKRELEKGHGDYQVFVTDDEEGNGYHALWYIGECAKDMVKENREYCEENNHDLYILDDADKAIYLG